MQATWVNPKHAAGLGDTFPIKWHHHTTKQWRSIKHCAHHQELVGLYIMARKVVYIRIILEELGHKQPPTPLQTYNTMADAIINGKIQPKQTKAMDMRFHCYETANVNNNSEYTGDPARWTMPTTWQNIIQNCIIGKYAKNSSRQPLFSKW